MENIFIFMFNFSKVAKIYSQNKLFFQWGQEFGNVCNKFDHMETLVPCKFQNSKFVGSTGEASEFFMCFTPSGRRGRETLIVFVFTSFETICRFFTLLHLFACFWPFYAGTFWDKFSGSMFCLCYFLKNCNLTNVLTI